MRSNILSKLQYVQPLVADLFVLPYNLQYIHILYSIFVCLPLFSRAQNSTDASAVALHLVVTRPDETRSVPRQLLRTAHLVKLDAKIIEFFKNALLNGNNE